MADLVEDHRAYSWYYLYINPEPWAVGPLDLGRKGGKLYATMGQNQQLAAYQQAVRDELSLQQPEMIEGRVTLRAWFWRNRAEYTTPAQRQHRKHEADGTNLFKALEDACQGILFPNDRDVVHGDWYLVEQGPEVVEKVLIQVGPAGTPYTYVLPIPEHVWAALHAPKAAKDDNSWPPK